MKLEGKCAIVTGGTGGLGWYICQALADSGMKIVLVYQQAREKAEDYASQLRARGAEALALQADATTDRGIAAMAEAAEKHFGGADALVLNAAYNQWVPFPDLEALDPEIWSRIMDYNLTAPYKAIRLMGPQMKKRGGGRIVTISSVAGFHPSGSSIAYCVSKAALIHLTRCTAVALAPEVLVNGVAPGLMEGTRMTANLAPEYAEAARRSALIGKAADREDVADAVRTLIATDSITGQTLIVDGGKVYH